MNRQQPKPFDADARAPLHPADKRIQQKVRTTSTWLRYTVFYNWTRVHKTLRMTPAMEAGRTDRLWSMEDITELVEAAAPKPGLRRPYKGKL